MTEEQRRQFQELSRMLIAGFSFAVPKEDELRDRLELLRPLAGSLTDQHLDQIFDEIGRAHV